MFGCDLHVCYSNRKNLTLGSLWLLLALGMALVSPPLLAQLGMTSCSYDGDDSVLEPGARVFDLSAWKALCCGRPSPVDGDGDEVV